MRKRKVLFVVLPIVLIVLAIVIMIALYFTTDIFRGKQELFFSYFGQNGEIFTILENVNMNEQKQFKENNSYQSRGELSLSVQNNENTQRVKATTASRYDVNNGRIYSEMNIKNGEDNLLTISYINSEDIYAIKCNDIIKNYLGIRNNDLQAFASNMGLSEEMIKDIPNSIDFDSMEEIWKITDEQKQHIIDTYSKVIVQSIEKDKYTKLGKKTVLVEGMNYETNAYKITLDEETMKQIVINCLSTLKSDNATLVMLSNKLSSVGITSEYTDITKMAELIDKMIVEFQEVSTDGGNVIEITVYANKGKTLRTELKIELNSVTEIGDYSNITTENEGIALRTTTTNMNMITIDKTTVGNTLKAMITIEQSQTSITENGITGKTTEGTPETNTSQIILQKDISDVNIINGITFIPDVTNMNQMTTISTNIGRLQDGTISNSSDVTINRSLNDNDIETVRASYIQNIEAVDKVEEIMELKNSNTIIINNYPKKQLDPFLTNVGQKVEQVIPNKIGQLGIDLGMSQNGNGLTTNNLINSSNNIIKTISILGASSVSMANVNGMPIESYATVGIIGLGTYIYNQMSSAVLDKVDEAQTQLKQQEEKQKELVANMQAQIDELIN